MIVDERIEHIRNSTSDIVLHLGYMNNLIAHIGSVSQCYALQKLGERDLTPLELSAELLLDRTTISRLTKDLVQRGFCKTQIKMNDRRSHILKLTALGREKLHEINRIARGQVQKALKNLTPEQQDTVSKGLSLYAHALKESSFIKVDNGQENTSTKNLMWGV